MCEFRGAWKIVAGQRALGARQPVAANFAVPVSAPHEKFSTLCSPPNGNRTLVLLDAICQFFKDNPTWE